MILTQLTWAASKQKLLMMAINIILSQKSVDSQPAMGEGSHSGA